MASETGCGGSDEGKSCACAGGGAPGSPASSSQDVVPADSPSRTRSKAPRKVIRRNLVPDSILKDPQLNEAVSVLNANYDFEIHKTVWRIKKGGVKRVGLQFPEGLLMYSCAIADILEKFAGVEHTVILGDTTFGACCVDDFSAKAMGVRAPSLFLSPEISPLALLLTRSSLTPHKCELLIHYGHSCLVPVDETSIPCMYIFVNMKIDLQHFIESVKLTFEPDTRIILAGTIQFNKEMHASKKVFKEHFASVHVPQCKPLSSGEVLGCTAPQVSQEGDVIVFIADGRFHLEALMIANPTIPAYRYDPYGRVLTLEKYDHDDMRRVRGNAVEAASRARSFGLVLGTLGRQGNPRILHRLEELLASRGLPYVVCLMSELTPEKLALMKVDAWIQIACPRLSIDWGEGFDLPILSPYEAWQALAGQERNGSYRMDFYSLDTGPWGNKFDPKKAEAAKEAVGL